MKIKKKQEASSKGKEERKKSLNVDIFGGENESEDNNHNSSEEVQVNANGKHSRSTSTSNNNDDEDGHDNTNAVDEVSDELTNESKKKKSKTIKLLPRKKKEGADSMFADVEDKNKVNFEKLGDVILDKKFDKKTKIDESKILLEAKERTEMSNVESEYGSSATAITMNASSKLIIPQQKPLISLDKLAAPLEKADGNAETKRQISQLKKTQVIESLPPKIIQDRATRAVAYEQASEIVSQWLPEIQKNREAKQLNFASKELGGLSAPSITVRSIAVNTFPETDMEKEIEAVLKQSGLRTETDITKKENEDLIARKMSQDDVEKRHKELARMRVLMFYEEQKAKRAKKIKSKLYRKIKKRQKHRDEERARELLRQTDPEAAKALDEQEALKRAEERMSLKHRNTSRYMRDLIKSRGGRHDAIGEVNALKSELNARMSDMPKIRGSGDIDDSEEDEDEDESDDDEDDEEYAELSKKKRMERLQQKAYESGKQFLTEIENDKLGNEVEMKGIMGLKFMRKALDDEKRKAEEAAKDLLRDLARDMDVDDDDNNEYEGNGQGNVALGRRSFQPVAKPESEQTKKRKAREEEERKTQEENDEDDYGIGEDPDDYKKSKNGKGARSEKKEKPNAPPKKRRAVINAFESESKSLFDVPDFGEEEKNDTEVEREPIQSQRKSKTSNSIPSSLSNAENHGNKEDDGNANPWLNQQTSNRDQSSVGRKSKDVMVDVSGALEEESETEYGNEDKDNDEGDDIGDSNHDRASNDDDYDDDGDFEAQQNSKLSKKAEQAELIKRAFADAGAIEEEFEKEKDDALGIAMDEGEKKLAGWGEWTGLGVTVSQAALKRKKMEEEMKKKMKEKELREKRAKAYPEGLKHVISISTREAKSAEKYYADKIPYPFQTWEQYERSLSNPLGSEWKTIQAFDHTIKPEIRTKPGVVIQPLKQPKEVKDMIKSLAKANRKDMIKKRNRSRKL